MSILQLVGHELILYKGERDASVRPSKPASPFVRDWTRKFHSDDVRNKDRSSISDWLFLGLEFSRVNNNQSKPLHKSL